MKARLHVTEGERLCYSRRKLQAISALRNAGIDPSIYGMHKDYRVPGVRGKVYLMQHPTGNLYYFSTLHALRVYVTEYQAWKTQRRFTWAEWLREPAREPLKRPICAWTNCKFFADGIVEGQPFCWAHGFIYEQMLLAKGRRAS